MLPTVLRGCTSESQRLVRREFLAARVYGEADGNTKVKIRVVRGKARSRVNGYGFGSYARITPGCFILLVLRFLCAECYNNQSST